MNTFFEVAKWVHQAFGPASSILIAFIIYLIYQLRNERTERKEIREQLLLFTHKAFETQLKFKDLIYEARDAFKSLERTLNTDPRRERPDDDSGPNGSTN